MGARPGTVYDDPEFVVGGLDNLTAAAGSNRNSFVVEDDGDDVAFGGFGDAQEFGGGEFEDTAAAIVAAVTADTNMTPIKSPSASMISRPASRMSMAEAMQGGKPGEHAMPTFLPPPFPIAHTRYMKYTFPHFPHSFSFSVVCSLAPTFDVAVYVVSTPSMTHHFRCCCVRSF